MSDVYAQTGKWNEAANIWATARERGLDKVPGYDLVELYERICGTWNPWKIFQISIANSWILYNSIGKVRGAHSVSKTCRKTELLESCGNMICTGIESIQNLSLSPFKYHISN